MKTHVIQLEAHDDIISSRDKMGWSKAKRILLIWPAHGRILLRRIDLVLLQRHAVALGAHLALVTRDSEVRQNARQLGIPVFNNPRQAQSQRWRFYRRRRARPARQAPRPDFRQLWEQNHPKTPAWLESLPARLSLFSLSILALMVVVAALFPGASIALTPKIKIQEVSMPVAASLSTSATNLSGSLPAYRITLIVEARDSIPTTGKAVVPEKSALGSVRFTNLTDQEVLIPAATIVSTLGENPIRFQTTRESKTPAGPGKTTFVPIKALMPGKASNLPPHSIQAIEGSLGLRLSVTNLASTEMGSDQLAPGPSDKDRSRLYDLMLAALQQNALEELSHPGAAGLETGDYIITQTIKLSRVLEKTYHPAEEFPAEQLELILRVEFETLVVSYQDLQALVIPILNANLPVGFKAIPETLLIQHEDAPKKGNPTTDGVESYHWRISARRRVEAIIQPPEAANLARGLPIAQAAERMATRLPLGEQPVIHPSPSWWPYLPFMPFRIRVAVSTAGE